MNKEYKSWLQELKQRIRSSQIKAVVKVNIELIELYWSLGKEIVNKEKESNWGSAFLNTLSDDLKAEFPEIKGLSLTNLKYIRLWVNFYLPLIGQQAVDQLKNEILQEPVESSTETIQQAVGQIGQQAVDRLPTPFATIPWGHHLQIITKCKKLDESLFYTTNRRTWLEP